MRRQPTQSYLDAVDWTDPGHVAHRLRAAERLLDGFEPGSLRHSAPKASIPPIRLGLSGMVGSKMLQSGRQVPAQTLVQGGLLAMIEEAGAQNQQTY